MAHVLRRLFVVAFVVSPPLLARAAVVKTEITAVTVYADRAQVTRTAPVTLGGGAVTFVVQGLPGWIDPDSVRAALEPASAGEVLDVTVEKSFLLAPTEQSVRRADEALLAVQDQLSDIRDEQLVLQAKITQLEGVRAFSMDKLPQDMATREVDVATFAKTVDYVTGELREARAALRGLARRQRDLEPELVARTKERDTFRARAQIEQQAVTVVAKGSGKATLRLTYLTSGATWEPVSELRVARGGREVGLVQSASVVQTTGEDWTDAALTFSTQLPQETLVVPEVQALLLGRDGEGLGAALERANASFARSQAAYLEQNRLANMDNPHWHRQQMQQSAIQARATTVFQQLASRGTTAHFPALAGRPVRSDGKSVRVAITSSRFDADVRHVAVPEVSLNVIRTAALVNTGSQPLLPGRSMLYVEGAFVGQSELPFVAPGETFSTFLGVHDGVKLERAIDRKRSEKSRGWRRTTVNASFVITAENLGAEAITIELGDRVPVPQDDDIDLDDVALPKSAAQDRDGVVKWTATLEPGKKASWRLEYALEYPNDFLARGRPAEEKGQMYDQIQSFESML